MKNKSQQINEEYYARMMIPSRQETAKFFEQEEEKTLRELIQLECMRNEFQLVVVGAGTLSYIEMAITHRMDYIAIDPLIDLYLQRQVRFILDQHENIKYINKCFGDFDISCLGLKNNIYAFIFNIIAYVDSPIQQINKYVKDGDIVFVSSWSNTKEARYVRQCYFNTLNATSASIPQKSHCNEFIGEYNLDCFNCEEILFHKTHKRIKNSITDTLIIFC